MGGYTQSTIRDAAGNIVGYQAVTAQNPYYAQGVSANNTQQFANYNAIQQAYNYQHNAIVGSSGTLYNVAAPNQPAMYAGVQGASLVPFQPTPVAAAAPTFSGRAAVLAANYVAPQQSVYWKPESQLQKEYAADVMQKSGMQPSVYKPLLDKAYGVDYVNPYAEYYNKIYTPANVNATPTVSQMPSSFYMREGLSNKEILNAKVAVDQSGGAFGVYATRPERPGFTPRYGFAVAGGSAGAAQSGGFGFAPTSPWVTNQWNDSLSPRGDAKLAAEIMKNPAGFSRPGAEAYGGLVQPLDNRTLQPDTQMGRYPNNPWNLANFVNPLGANLPKDQMATEKVPWQINNFNTAPTLQSVNKEGAFAGLTMPPTPSQRAAADVSGGAAWSNVKAVELPSYQSGQPAYSSIKIATPSGLQPATPLAPIKASDMFMGMTATPIGTTLPAGSSPRTELPSTITRSEDWLSGVFLGKEIGSLPAGKVVAAVQDASIFGNLLTGKPFTRSTEGDKTLGDYQTQYLPTSKVPSASVSTPVGLLSFKTLAENLSSPVMQEPTIGEQKTPMAIMAGRDDFFVRTATSPQGLETAPWVPSKGVTYSGGSRQLTDLGNYLGKQKSEIDIEQSALYASAKNKFTVGSGWGGTEEERLAYNEKAAVLSDKVGRYNRDLTTYEGLAKANPIYATPYDMSKTTVVTTKSTIIGDTAYGTAFAGAWGNVKARTPSPALVEALGNMAVNASGIERFSPTAATVGRETVGWGAGGYSLIRDKPVAAVAAGVIGYAGGYVFKLGLGVLAIGTSLAASSSLPVIGTVGRVMSTTLAGYAGGGAQALLGGAAILGAVQDIHSQPTARARGEKGMEYFIGFGSFGIGMGKGWTPDIKSADSRWYNPYAGGKGFATERVTAPDGTPMRKISYGEGTGLTYGEKYGNSAGEYSIIFGRRASDNAAIILGHAPAKSPFGVAPASATPRLGAFVQRLPDVFATTRPTESLHGWYTPTPAGVRGSSSPITMSPSRQLPSGGSPFGETVRMPSVGATRAPEILGDYTPLPGGVAGTFTALPEGYFNMRRASQSGYTPVSQNILGTFSELAPRTPKPAPMAAADIAAMGKPGKVSIGGGAFEAEGALGTFLTPEGYGSKSLYPRALQAADYAPRSVLPTTAAPTVALGTFEPRYGAKTELAPAPVRQAIDAMSLEQKGATVEIFRMIADTGETMFETRASPSEPNTVYVPSADMTNRLWSSWVQTHPNAKGWYSAHWHVSDAISPADTTPSKADNRFALGRNALGEDLGRQGLIGEYMIGDKYIAETRPYKYSEGRVGVKPERFEQVAQQLFLDKMSKGNTPMDMEGKIAVQRETNKLVAAENRQMFFEREKPGMEQMLGAYINWKGYAQQKARGGLAAIDTPIKIKTGQQSFELYGVLQDSLVPIKRAVHKNPAPSTGKNTILAAFDQPANAGNFPTDAWDYMRKDVVKQEPLLQITAGNQLALPKSTWSVDTSPIVKTFSKEIASEVIGGKKIYYTVNDFETGLVRERGFDAKPTVLDLQSFDAFKSDYPTLYRGVSKPKYAADFVSGKYHPGSGVYGSGTYTAYDWMHPDFKTPMSGLSTARDYGQNVLVMKLKPGSKVVKPGDIQYEKEMFQGRSDEKVADLFNDIGTFGILKGVDAIDESRMGYMILLNRAAVVVARPPAFYNKQMPSRTHNALHVDYEEVPFGRTSILMPEGKPGVLRKDVIAPATFERIPSRRGAIVKVGGKFQTMPSVKPDLLLKVVGAPAGSVYEGSTAEIFAPMSQKRFDDTFEAHATFDERISAELIAGDRAGTYKKGREGHLDESDNAYLYMKRSSGDYRLFADKGQELAILRGEDQNILAAASVQTRRASLDHIGTAVGGAGIGGNVMIPLIESRLRDVYGFRQYEVQSATTPRTMQFYAGKVGGVLDKVYPSERIFTVSLYPKKPDTLHKDVIQPQKKYELYPKRPIAIREISPIEVFGVKTKGVDTGHTIEHYVSLAETRAEDSFRYKRTPDLIQQDAFVRTLDDTLTRLTWNNPGARNTALEGVREFGMIPRQHLLLNVGEGGVGAVLTYNIFTPMNEMSINYIGARRGALRQNLGYGGETTHAALKLGKESGATHAILKAKDTTAADYWKGKWNFEMLPDQTMIKPLTPKGKLVAERRRTGFLDIEEGSFRSYDDAQFLEKNVIKPEPKKMQSIFTEYKPQTELDVIRSERSKQTYKPSTTAKQQAASSSEQFVARLVGGETTPRFHPVDILNVGDWAVEVKTVFPGAHEKMTMHGYDTASGYNALESKRLFVEGRNQIWSLPSGVNSLQGASLMRVMATNKIYVKEGFGSYRSSAMTEVTPSQIAGMRNVDALNELLRKDVVWKEEGSITSRTREPRNLFEERTGLISYGRKPLKKINAPSQEQTGSRLSQEDVTGVAPLREMELDALREQIGSAKPHSAFKELDVIASSEPSAMGTPMPSERFKASPKMKGSTGSSGNKWVEQQRKNQRAGKNLLLEKMQIHGKVSDKATLSQLEGTQVPQGEMGGMVRIRGVEGVQYGMPDPVAMAQDRALLQMTTPPKKVTIGGVHQSESAVKMFDARDAAKVKNQPDYYWGQKIGKKDAIVTYAGQKIQGYQSTSKTAGKRAFEEAIAKSREWEAARSGTRGLVDSDIGKLARGVGGKQTGGGGGVTGTVKSPVRQGRGAVDSFALGFGGGGSGKGFGSMQAAMYAPLSLADQLGTSARARQAVRQRQAEEQVFEHTRLPPGMQRPSKSRQEPQTYLSQQQDSRLTQEQRGQQLAMQKAQQTQGIMSVPRTRLATRSKQSQELTKTLKENLMLGSKIAAGTLLVGKQRQQAQLQLQFQSQTLLKTQDQAIVTMQESGLKQLTAQQSMQMQEPMLKQELMQYQSQKQDQITSLRQEPRLMEPQPRPLPTETFKPFDTPPPVPPVPPILPPFGWFPGGGSDPGAAPGRHGKRAHREVIPVQSEFENYGMGSGGHKLKKRRRR